MLKLYKKTISITSVAAAGCFLLSILFEFLCFPHSTFLQNIFIGAFCSLIVVIITTILQYRSEHSNVLKDYSNVLRLFIFNLSLINNYIDEPLNEKQYEHFYEEFDELFCKVRECNENLVWFSTEKMKLQEKVFQYLGSMYLKFKIGSTKSYKDSVDALIKHQNCQDLTDACIEFLPDGLDKDFILKYIKSEH